MDRLSLFPDATRIEKDVIHIGGQDLSALAATYGTPLYVYDRVTMDAAVARYKQALKAFYPAASSITYAGKAFLCKAVAQWVRQERLSLDCTGEGEIAYALAAGLPPDSIIVHGANKSVSDLRSSIQHAHTVVVDNLDELQRIVELFGAVRGSSSQANSFPNLWLRLQPGIQVETHHAHTQTGHADSKFGMIPEEIAQAAQIARSSRLPLVGLHFHLGSNFRDVAPLTSAIELALDLVREVGFSDSWHFSPGGGWAVAYHEDELPQPEIETYVRAIGRTIVRRCRLNNLRLPQLHLEPGRSLIARAGVAVYRVGAIKKRGGRTWLLTDGGMADNPRHALYASKYTALPVSGASRPMTDLVSIGGPFCESGDVILEDLRLPILGEGELVAVPVSGAYHLSMSSNYNGSRRPAVLWLEKGSARLIVRRETLDDLLQRDLSLT